jgi:hypothetical protein
MKRRRLIVTGCALALAAGVVGAAQAVGGDDESETVTGSAAERAKAAALRLTGGGRANSVERDSEDGATWEVEVTRPDGKTVDVRLDEHYRLVVIESDTEEPDDRDDGQD